MTGKGYATLSPIQQTIIYEMHVRGFTRSPSSNVEPRKRGTYAGLIEKILPANLGITAVELLPVFQFDPQERPLALQLLGITLFRFSLLMRDTRHLPIHSLCWTNSVTW